MASRVTVEALAQILLRYVPRRRLPAVLRDLEAVAGNRSFRETALRLAAEVRSAAAPSVRSALREAWRLADEEERRTFVAERRMEEVGERRLCPAYRLFHPEQCILPEAACREHHRMRDGALLADEPVPDAVLEERWPR